MLSLYAPYFLFLLRYKGYGLSLLGAYCIVSLDSLNRYLLI